MSDMDFERASRILNMDLLGLSADDFEDDDRLSYPQEWDEAYDNTEEPRGQQYSITVYYDADTELEAQLIASDVMARARRTTADNVRGEMREGATT